MPVSLKDRQQKRRNLSGDPDKFRMPLWDHIGELRDRIFRAATLIAVLWVVGWFLQPGVYHALTSVANAAVEELKRSNPSFEFKEPFSSFAEPFMLKLRLSFMIGLGLSLPFLVLQIWGFVAPGLRPEEKRPIKMLAPMSVALFGLGVYFCWLVLPTTFRWFLGFMAEFPGTVLYPEPGTMVFFILKMLLAFGVGFQLPLVIYIAARLGLIGPDTLTHYWRHAVTFVFLASAVLTPSGDAFSMLMMAVPLTILMMISIAAVKLTVKKPDASRIPELNELD